MADVMSALNHKDFKVFKVLKVPKVIKDFFAITENFSTFAFDKHYIFSSRIPVK